MKLLTCIVLGITILFSGCSKNPKSLPVTHEYEVPNPLRFKVTAQEYIIEKRILYIDVEVTNLFDDLYIILSGKLDVYFSLNGKQLHNYTCDVMPGVDKSMATCRLDDIEAGILEVYAKYPGDSKNLPTVSDVSTFEFEKFRPFMDWGSPVFQHLTAGEEIQLKLAMITTNSKFPPTPFGVVTFHVYGEDDQTVIAECVSEEIIRNFDYVASSPKWVQFLSSCTLPSLERGRYRVVATYSGDKYYSFSRTTREFGGIPAMLEID